MFYILTSLLILSKNDSYTQVFCIYPTVLLQVIVQSAGDVEYTNSIFVEE